MVSPWLAIVACVGGGQGGSLLLTIARDACHGGLARSFLPVAQHLSEKRPDHQRRRIDGSHAKQIAVFGEHPFDPFGGQHFGKRQTGLSQKRVDNFLKTVAARMGRIR